MMKINKTIFIIPFLCMFFLWEMIFENKVPLAFDSSAHAPIKKWSENVSKNYDSFPQWFPNLFSGMPAYGGYINTSGDPTGLQTQKFFFDNKGLRMWFWLCIGGIGIYKFLRYKRKNRKSSLFGGIAYSLTPHIFGLINAGHSNKIMAVAFIPWVFFSVYFLFQSKSIKAVLLLSIVSALQLWMNHPQIVYYTWMFIAIWYIYYFISRFIRTRSLSSAKILILLIISIIITTLMVLDPYLDIFTFQKHSNRGALSVLDNSNETSSGTKWDYATQWSFHPAELISFILPYHFGLQNFTMKVKNRAEFIKNQSYWGYMPFTQSTHYMGLLVLVLPLISLIIRYKNVEYDNFEGLIWFIIFIFLIIGFGKHFSIIYKPLYDYAPFFSKFRIPSMIYILLVFCFSFLSASAIDYILKSDKNYLLDTSKIVLGTLIFLLFILFFLGEDFLSFSFANDSNYPSMASIFKANRIDYFNKGLVLGIILSTSTLGLIWSYVNGRLSKNYFSYLIIAILVLDLWILNREFLVLTKKKDFASQFQTNSKIEYLLNDNDNFRIFPVEDFNSNKYGYWGLQSIGGYRAIKLRNYQDMIDDKRLMDPRVLNMLNVKYLLTNSNVRNSSFKKVSGFKTLYENLDYFPRAWFVRNLINVKDQKSSFEKIKEISFRPKETAVVIDYDGPDLDSEGELNIEKLELFPNEIKIKCITDGGALLVLSEIYYDPGWKCKVDGINSKIYQTNHILRSVYVPNGEHEVIFYYDDSDWMTARIISRSSFIISIILVCFLFYRDRKVL